MAPFPGLIVAKHIEQVFYKIKQDLKTISLKSNCNIKQRKTHPRQSKPQSELYEQGEKKKKDREPVYPEHQIAFVIQ